MNESAHTLLKVDKLSFSFGQRKAVDNVSFTIQTGSVFGLLGPNGAGKSTTISCLSGLLDGYAGTMELSGQPFSPSRSTSDRAKVGVVPQELALYENLTAQENLSLFGSLYGLRGVELKSQVDSALELAGLTDRRKETIEKFSGGMKRRLNLAVGLMHRPQFLLLDEPTVGVDPQSRSHLFDCFDLLKDQGMTLLYTTHYMEEAERLCDAIAIMNEGVIVRCGSAKQLRESIDDPMASLEQVFLTLTGRKLRD